MFQQFKRQNLYLLSGFIAMLILISILGYAAIREVKILGTIADDIYTRPMTFSNAVLEIHAHINSIHRYMKDVALANNDEELELAISHVDSDEMIVHTEFNIATAHFHGDKTKLLKIRKTFSDWKPIRSEVIELMRLGKINQAGAITKGKGAEHVNLLTRQIIALVDFTYARANEFHNTDTSRINYILTLMYGLCTFILIIGLIISYYIIRKINVNSMKLMENEERYRSLSMSSPITVIITVDQAGTIISWNPAAAKTFEYNEVEILNRPLTDIMPERYRSDHLKGFQHALKSEDSLIMKKTIQLHGLKKSGEEFPLELSLGAWKQGGKKYFSGIIHDITERKQTEDALQKHAAELALRNNELKDALDNIKILSDMIPICSYCKKIRDDQGYWNQLEDFISSHSETQFSHGICPECKKNELEKLKNEKT